MDEALTRLTAAISLDEVREVLVDIRTIWNEDIPMAMLYSTEWVTIAHGHVSGLEFTRDATVMFHNAFIEQ